ncbi:hypothetical protein JCM19239_3202 [Vibrio variabilis]|uniref:Uncharacterized protein n=1 Tax=Vibrio variabilis TaxID=990271 RepID=A0ABQ0JIE2_9VIBR|nr:hypothetical protein JCM19239_3202 [Vibrio variabilis]
MYRNMCDNMVFVVARDVPAVLRHLIVKTLSFEPCVAWLGKTGAE